MGERRGIRARRGVRGRKAPGRWAAAVGLAVLSATLGGLAPVDGEVGAGVSVGSDGARVTVSGYRAGGEDHPQWSATSPAGAMVCRELVSLTNGLIDGDGAGSGRQWPPLEAGRVPRWRYWLDCRYLDGSPVELGDGGLGFVYADEVVDYDAAVRTLAQRYLAERLAPSAAIAVSPPVGLAGVEQWFGVDGYDGAVVEEVHDVLGRRVVLTLELQGVRWAFGDGATVTYDDPAGLGPPGAPVRHRYRSRSTSDTDPDGRHAVTATVRVGVRYTLDGGPPLTVDPPLSVELRRELLVREAQAVLHR